jgi:hypothetical protein
LYSCVSAKNPIVMPQTQRVAAMMSRVPIGALAAAFVEKFTAHRGKVMPTSIGC